MIQLAPTRITDWQKALAQVGRFSGFETNAYTSSPGRLIATARVLEELGDGMQSILRQRHRLHETARVRRGVPEVES